MTQLLIVVPSCLGQRLLWSPLLALYTICEQAYLNLILYVGRLWIWISTRDCLEHPGYQQMFVVNIFCFYSILPQSFFGQRGCRMEVHSESRHIVVLRRGQFCSFFYFLVALE